MSSERPITLQCPQCRELVPLGAFVAEAGVLSFECAACGATIRRAGRAPVGTGGAPVGAMAAPPAAPPRNPVAPTAAAWVPPPAAAPPGPAAPVQAPTAVSATAPTPNPREPDGVDPVLWKAWVTLAAAWDNPRAHDAFVATCLAAQALPFAGVRYRDHLAEHPGDSMATRGRDRVLGQAMALVQSRASDAADGPAGVPRGKVLVWVVTAVMMVLAGWQLTRALRTLNQTTELPAE